MAGRLFGQAAESTPSDPVAVNLAEQDAVPADYVVLGKMAPATCVERCDLHLSQLADLE